LPPKLPLILSLSKDARRSSEQSLRLFGVILAAWLSAAPAFAASVDVTATPLTADDSPQAINDRLELLAGFELTSSRSSWGGISGASIAPDGGILTVISDYSRWFRLPLQHEDSGRLIGVGTGTTGRLKDEHGDRILGKRIGDAEALTRGPDGSFYVSFEGWHRLWRYRPASDPLLAAAKHEARPKGMADLPLNEGVEAAALLPDGRFLLLSEGGYTDSGDLKGWLGSGKRWSEIGLAPSGAFRPTDLAVLPSGDLLLLERRVSVFGGFAARLSVIAAAAVEPGARLAGREIAVIAKPLPVDNFEAVTARAAPDGSVLIYMLSDDNFNDMERTLLLQFRWRP
jgi:hypothetical protein